VEVIARMRQAGLLIGNAAPDGGGFTRLAGTVLVTRLLCRLSAAAPARLEEPHLGYAVLVAD